MSEIKLFETKQDVRELVSSQVALEKELQVLIENNMEQFFGVRFLASEYVTSNGGRMDSIGIDENNCPIIFEYKRSKRDNVINQGLFYLDWLLDHKDSFKLLVLDRLGKDIADNIEWSFPSVICIANDFTRYDVHAVNQMQRNIRLVKYRKYDNLILFEYLNAPNVVNVEEESGSVKISSQKTHVEKVAQASETLRNIYDNVCDFIESLGDDISKNQLKLYLAYKKVQNFACIEIYNKKIILNLKLNPDKVQLEEGFTRDMTNVGHYGTGDLQVSISNDNDFEKAKPLIERAYNEN
jgi:predicted transport protein